MSTTIDFYKNLESFSDFGRLDEEGLYSRVPADWYVVICDIRGSTKAIEEGRYQDVNTIGAASIAAVQNAWPSGEFPFVFGGDGASLVIPGTKIDAVKAELLRLRNFSQAQYEMELRVGCVSVAEIDRAGVALTVAKFAIAEKKTIALMRGGGLTWAETRIKGEPEKYCWSDTEAGVLEELKGLSCRWHPLNSQKGEIVSLLIKPRKEEPGVLTEILANLTNIVEGGLDVANPVNAKSMKYKSISQTIASERGFLRSRFSRNALRRLIGIFVSIAAFRFRLPLVSGAARYPAQIPSHSDYRKFDDMLRLVLDCTTGQIQSIDDYLSGLQREKLIYFGLHRSSHALMTCFVETLADGGHIHFIDGGGGGYAMAAKSLKLQMTRD